MFPIVGYFLAAVMVMTGLVPYGDLRMALCVGSILIVAAAYRNYSPRLKRGTWLAILAVVLLGNMIIWCQWAAIPIPMQFILYGIICGILSLAWKTRVSFLNALIICFPICGLLHIWMYPLIGGKTDAGMELLLWSLATWPFVTLMSQGRLMTMASLLAAIGIPSVMYRLLIINDVPPHLFAEMLASFWQYSSIELTIIQVVLVIVSVGPLLINSGIMWRWLAVFGILFIAGPLCIISVTGPWYGDWPPLLWYILIPATIAVMVGMIGMLCTVKRSEFLNDTALRALSLGIGASAVLVLPFIHEIPAREEILTAFAPAIAPLIWALALSGVIALASFVARKTDEDMDLTNSWEKTKSRIAINFKMRMSSFVKEFIGEVKDDTNRWLNPGSFVPFIIFCSTYPVFPLLHQGAWLATVLIFISFLSARLWAHSIILWTMANTALLFVAALSLSMDWVLAMTVMPAMILLLWLFVRWPSWNASWAYAAILVCITMVQVPILMMQGADPIPIVLACGVVVLLCNGLQDGKARWFILPLTSILILIYLSWWVKRGDPFAMVMHADQTEEWLSIIYRLPVLLLILYVLMWSRQSLHNKEQFISANLSWQRLLLIISALVLTLAWCFSWRPNWMGALLVIAIMVLNARDLFNHLVHISRDAIRWPLLDALTILLASLLINAGECYEYYLMHQRNTGTVQAGSLSSFVHAAERDGIACVLAVVSVYVAMRLQTVLSILLWIRNLLTKLVPKFMRKQNLATDSHPA